MNMEAPEGNSGRENLSVDQEIEFRMQNPPRILHPKPRWKFGSAFRGLAATALVMGSSVDVVQAQEQTLSPEHREILESVLGVEVMTQLEAAGFEIHVEVEAVGNAPYIVHIGQRHSHPLSGLNRIASRDAAVDFQSTLYEVLPAVAEISDGVIFSETYAAEMGSVREYIEGQGAKLESAAETEIATIAEAQALSHLLDWYNQHKTHGLVSNFINPETVTRAQEQLTVFLARYIPQDDYEQSLMEVLSASNTSLLIGAGISQIAGNVAFGDAVHRLYMEHRIEVLPAEDEETNSTAYSAMEDIAAREPDMRALEADVVLRNPDIQQMMDSFRELAQRQERLRGEGSDLTDTEKEQMEELRLQVQQRYDQLKEEFEQLPQVIAFREAVEHMDELVYTERENAALRRIEEFVAAGEFLNPAQNIVLVYGNNHDFAPELIAHNTNNEEDSPDRGLITVKIPSIDDTEE